jgi:hypothetical protein
MSGGETVTDDPRLKRVLKRYRKLDEHPDASIDVTALGIVQLRTLVGCAEGDPLIAPRALDSEAAARFGAILGVPLELEDFDFFLHCYVRTECVTDYYADPTARPLASPENGPPAKIPLPKGMRWLAVRPRDGKEHYIGVPEAS